MLPIIGREKEQALLKEAFHSSKPEFIALYGRRRVGKTYLVRNSFENTEEALFFYATGTKDGETRDQIKNFTESMAETFWYPGAAMEVKKGWRDTFKMLTDTMRASN